MRARMVKESWNEEDSDVWSWENEQELLSWLDPDSPAIAVMKYLRSLGLHPSIERAPANENILWIMCYDEPYGEEYTLAWVPKKERSWTTSELNVREDDPRYPWGWAVDNTEEGYEVVEGSYSDTDYKYVVDAFVDLLKRGPDAESDYMQ